MQKIIAGIIMAIGVIIASGIGAMVGALAGAILFPVKIFNVLSDDSAGKASDKI